MRSGEFDFNLGRLSGWFSTRPETLSLGVIIVRRFGHTELHIGLIIAEFCVFTTKP